MHGSRPRLAALTFLLLTGLACAQAPIVDRDTGAMIGNTGVALAEGVQFVNPTTFSLGSARLLLRTVASGSLNIGVVDFGVNPIGTVGGGVSLGTVVGVPVPVGAAFAGETLAVSGLTIDLSSLGATLQAGRLYAIRIEGDMRLGLGGLVFADVARVVDNFPANAPNFDAQDFVFEPVFQLFAGNPATTIVILVPTLAPLATTANQLAVARTLDGLFATGSDDLRTVYLQAGLLGTLAPLALESMSPVAYTLADELAASLSGEMTGILSDQLFAVRGGLRGPEAPTLSLDLFGPEDDGRPRGALDLVADGGGVEATDRSDLPDGWRVMARGLGSWLEANGTSSRFGFDSTSAGAIVGLDRTWGVAADDGTFSDSLTVGLAAAYVSTDVEFDPSGGDAEVEGFHFGPYLGIHMAGFHAGFQFLYGHNWYDADRTISFPGVHRVASADFEGDQYTGRIDAGHTWNAPTWSITTEGSLEYLRLEQEGFRESGAGALGLRVDERDHDSFRSSLGLRWEGDFATGGPTLRPSFRAAWVHEFLDDDREVRARFGGTAARFVVAGERANRDRARLGAGLRVEFSDSISGLLDYESEFDGDDMNSHGLSGGIEFRFR